MADSKEFKSMEEKLAAVMKTEEAQRLIKELTEKAPPFEELAEEEIVRIQEQGDMLAAKAQAYYMGYMRAVPGYGDQAADAGVTIVAATVGSVVGTTAGQIVGKKMDGSVNLREQVINPAYRKERLNINTKFQTKY